MVKVEFHGGDDWVLLAVIHGGRGAPAGLPAILAAGDWINHAIFNYGELRGGLARLLRAGLIRQTARGWTAVTTANRAAQVRGRGFGKQYEAVGKLMAAARNRPSAPRLKGMTPKRFKAAVQAYLEGPP
jgi:hypothetical protein